MSAREGRGRFWGVGVGPGDPELVTLKAARLIGAADVVAYHAGVGKQSNARRIAAEICGDAGSDPVIDLSVYQRHIDRNDQEGA